jgi:hypothetical protein
MTKVVTEQQWVTAMDNLNRRRIERQSLDDNAKLEQSIRNYRAHLDKCYVGKSVLDVGCGHQYLKQCLPLGVEYLGIDAFPVVPDTMKLAIDYPDFQHNLQFETVCCFATLDGVRDFDLACRRMKEIATKNIIILTGIGIDVDQYHTHRLEFEDFDRAFEGWRNTVRHMVSNKVWLLEYTK